MKLAYTQRWEISDKDILKLDKDRVELNKLTSIIGNQLTANPQIFLSRKTADERRKLARSMKKRIIKRYNNGAYPCCFDSIVLKDIETNVKKTISEDSYFDDNKSSKTIGKFISEIFEKSAYSKIISMGKLNDSEDEALHRHSLLMHSMNSRSLDYTVVLDRDSFPEVKRKFKEQLGIIKKEVDEFYKDIGILKEKPNYTIELSPYDFSFWEGEHFLMAINPARLPCFKNKKDEKYIFSRAIALEAGVHELGHGLHEKLSDEMPAGLRSNPEAYNILVNGIVGEGVALETEKHFVKWAKNHREKMNFSDFDIKIMDSSLKTYNLEKIPGIIHDILEIKELEDEKTPEQFSIKAHKKLAEITGIKRFQKDYYLFNDREFSETLQSMVYVFGQSHISNLYKKISNVLHTRNKGGESLALQSIMTGMWCDPKAQEKFILECYLPQAEKDKLIE